MTEIRPWVVGVFGIVLGIVLGYAYANDKTNKARQELSTIKSELSDAQTQHSRKAADFDKKVADFETQLSAAVKKAEGVVAELTTLKSVSDEKTKTIDGHQARISELQGERVVSARALEKVTLELERSRAEVDRLKLQVGEQSRIIKDQQTRIENLEKPAPQPPAN